MKGRIAGLLKTQPGDVDDRSDLLHSHGTTVPSDGATGYATGCLFAKTDGGAGTAIYLNEGSATSANFDAVSGLTAAQEAQIAANVLLLSATAGVGTASKAVILDSSGDLASGELVLADMAPGTGISTGTGTIHKASVEKIGSLFKTTIVVDITGLNDGGTAGDIIGKDGDTPNCHVGEITAAKNGTIYAGQIRCLEVPAGGNVDIDLWGTCLVGTGAQDTAITAQTNEVQLINHAAWSAGQTAPLTAFPGPGFMYLVNGASTDADYTTGIFIIELWGS